MLIILYTLLVMWWPLNVECCMFNLCILCCWYGMYCIVVTCPVLCNVIIWMQLNTNKNTAEDTDPCKSERRCGTSL